MKKTIILLCMTAIALLALSSCATANTDMAYANRTCSMCLGKGYYTIEDNSNWPYVTRTTTYCEYCGGKGYVTETYYLADNNYVIYNYPYRHRYYRHKPLPHRTVKHHKPAPRPKGNTRNGRRFHR